MRQFVLGLVVAAVAWWGYDHWTGGDQALAGPSVEAQGPAASDDLSAMLQTVEPERASEPVAKQEDGPALTAPGGNQLAADLASLTPRIAAREPAAVAKGWAAVATGRLGREHQGLVGALTPQDGGFAELLQALGGDNAFLHSAEGRTLAERALAAAMALPDDQALAAGTLLLSLMAKGRIDKADTAARAAVDRAYEQHRIRVDRWLCNPANLAGARTYTVASGDSLARIAGRFRREGLAVEAGTLAVLNRIHNPNALQVGQQIKVPVAPVTAVLEKRSYALMVFVGDQMLRLYWVGHGEHDRTPVTEFTVVEKQPRPEWTAPDGNRYPYGHPQNILGEYFIKFQHPQHTGFGAHGTPLPDTIGTMSSMGCIRMYDADIAELFQLLPRGAKVIVRASESVRS